MPRQDELKHRQDQRKLRLDEVQPFTYTFGVELEFVSRFGYQATASIIKTRYEAKYREDLVLTYEGYNHNNHNGNDAPWKLVSDASINSHNYAVGCELVSPILEGMLGFEKLLRVVNILETLSDEDKFGVNKSCGLHVHLGTQHMTPEEVKKFATNYVRSESAMDLLVPKSRRHKGHNGYCASNVKNIALNDGDNESHVAVSKAMETITNLKFSKNQTKQQKLDLLSSVFSTRFLKLNLSSLYHTSHKTMEVRHFGGTLNEAKIGGWLQTLDYMYRMSRTQVAFKVPSSDRNCEAKGNFRRLSAWFDGDKTVQDWAKGRKKELEQADARQRRNARRRANYSNNRNNAS